MNGVVGLPKTRPVLFPDRCALCGVARPGGRVAVTTLAVNSKAPLLRSFGPLSWVKMPACAGCRSCFRRQVWLRWSTFWVGFAVSIAAVVSVYGWYRGAGDKALWKMAVLALWLPWLIWQMWFPLPVSLSINGDAILYQFENSEFERDFEELNARDDAEAGRGGWREPPPIVV